MDPREKLNHYHQSEKVKVGIEYFAAPEPILPKHVADDPVAAGLKQSAQAFFELSRIYRNLGD